jgi:hypothetical protein
MHGDEMVGKYFLAHHPLSVNTILINAFLFTKKPFTKFLSDW